MAAETIIKTAFEILKGSGKVEVHLDNRGLGMAYAIPAGSHQRVVGDFGPWSDAEVKQVFYRQSSLVGSVLADIQMIMGWRYSAAQQYIIEANLDTRGEIDPTVRVDVTVRFGQPDLYDWDLEAYYIPFNVEVEFRPVGPTQKFNSKGQIRADGTGTFAAFQ